MEANDPIQQFRQALADSGILLPQRTPIIGDGELHRVSVMEDKRGERTGWYRLHLDAPVAGAGGDWRKQISVRWTMQRESRMSSKERTILYERIERERAEAQLELKIRHQATADRAQRLWNSFFPANPNHPYLLKKQILPGIARQSGTDLVLPVMGFFGELHGLQFISPDSSKRFLSGMAKKGHFIPVKDIPDGTKTVYMSEGWATASTLYAYKPDICHIAALDCGNLEPTALSAKKRWPKLDLVIVPDFDDIGQEKGQSAAFSVHAKILPLPEHIPEGATDWNDWHFLKNKKAN